MGIEERLPAISTGSHMVDSIGVPDATGSRNRYHLLSVVLLLYYESCQSGKWGLSPNNLFPLMFLSKTPRRKGRYNRYHFVNFRMLMIPSNFVECCIFSANPIKFPRKYSYSNLICNQV